MHLCMYVCMYVWGLHNLPCLRKSSIFSLKGSKFSSSEILHTFSTSDMHAEKMKTVNHWMNHFSFINIFHARMEVWIMLNHYNAPNGFSLIFKWTQTLANHHFHLWMMRGSQVMGIGQFPGNECLYSKCMSFNLMEMQLRVLPLRSFLSRARSFWKSSNFSCEAWNRSWGSGRGYTHVSLPASWKWTNQLGHNTIVQMNHRCPTVGITIPSMLDVSNAISYVYIKNNVCLYVCNNV